MSGRSKTEQREIIINAPRGFNVRVEASMERIVILVECGKKSVQYNKSVEKGNCGESVQITAPKILQVKVESSACKVKVTVEVEIELYTEYTREEVLQTVNRFEKRNPYLKGEIAEMKVVSLKETEVTIWMLSTTGQLLADTLNFHNLKDLEMDPKTKLSFITRIKAEELFNQLQEEERRKMFDDLVDAWMVKKENDKMNAEEKLREEMKNS